MQQVQYNKMHKTLKHNLRIDWKFGNKLILSVSTEQCHKNNNSESRNGPLRGWMIKLNSTYIDDLWVIAFQWVGIVSMVSNQDALRLRESQLKFFQQLLE